ncbi:hypothetical protein [Streptomyces sp. Isolate_219]|uniref:hypothetical protein n=1 Tax=Streptomyces sp. Isolate_219 TaxID=2950110 RepID=UPI0021C7C37E|nr:hypothetical protein [Streptomyces sp. Isolate_219]MCR8574884.1 hypothetical protein [Streptomyces sp. Isolate_219]
MSCTLSKASGPGSGAVALRHGEREAAVKPAQSVVSARLAAGARIVGPGTCRFQHLGHCGQFAV